ncbi:MAG: glycosyltransferase [Chitinophagaceae bacterium]
MAGTIRTVCIIGPAHPLRGGIAHFNDRLAKAFLEEGYDVKVYSFSLQYPSFLFPGKTQFTDAPPPAGFTIHAIINSINPLNWLQTGNRIRKEKPDLVVVRYWLPFMGPSLGTILRSIRKNKHSRIVCLADNIVPHEKRAGDNWFTKYFVKPCHAFVTMSKQVLNDLTLFAPNKPALLGEHPLYDDFGEAVPQQEARAHLNLPQNEPILLFFGFIRKYKGLDLLLHALKLLKEKGKVYKLLIAGEFYGDEQEYNLLIDELGIRDQLILRTTFIPDHEVRYYICAADFLVQPYRHATQSGVTPLAYHFNKPMLVTYVGGLPELVPDGKTGIVTAPDAEAIAAGIERFFTVPTDVFLRGIETEKKRFTWDVLVHTLIKAGSLP